MTDLRLRPQGVLLDVDGTLVDTAPDLVQALNLALSDFGLPEVSLAQMRHVASHGSLALVEAGAPMQPQAMKYELQHALLRHYARINGQHCVLFAGMAELLKELEQSGIPVGVVTNKAARFCRPLMGSLGIESALLSIVCGDSTLMAKPNAAPMLLAAQQLGVAPADIWYLGDAERDMQAAVNAGMAPVLALWGYLGEQDDIDSWPVEYRLNSPLELVQLIRNRG
ncbi:HAD family hydrolase [Shewanella sedimentimangrovi]|uniref:HAD-IA family hydrolase n=1 Tax=Shewanella sedimentimangrovi TaxID=2814293 RepID=A0ABX7R852_9GAMM|nr:HAD-IA family hydrolase [Shewanella sedimentimangrovi]QSX38946.1 HAD-IA family hydrolase [Shewanella sedimentimangrovi]